MKTHTLEQAIHQYIHRDGGIQTEGEINETISDEESRIDLDYDFDTHGWVQMEIHTDFLNARVKVTGVMHTFDGERDLAAEHDVSSILKDRKSDAEAVLAIVYEIMENGQVAVGDELKRMGRLMDFQYEREHQEHAAEVAGAGLRKIP